MLYNLYMYTVFPSHLLFLFGFGHYLGDELIPENVVIGTIRAEQIPICFSLRTTYRDL